ncbi:MAG TPA: hypothetical protein PKD55_26370 [Bellilinea sp.]|nr:hypothetical protein [Bellilinea sp.]
MRYALVDHSTLTATQRLLGLIPVKNLYQVDGDIAAFEGLLQAILLYDGLFLVDDYKAEFREERGRIFDFILPISPAEFAYDTFIKLAQQSTEGIMLRVEGGDISDSDIKSFFDMLRMQTVFTWRMRSSNFFLTLNMLADSGGLTIEKYSTLTQMIYSELSSKDTVNSNLGIGSTCELVDSFGRRVNNGYREGKTNYKVGSQVWAFASSLN